MPRCWPFQLLRHPGVSAKNWQSRYLFQLARPPRWAPLKFDDPGSHTIRESPGPRLAWISCSPGIDYSHNSPSGGRPNPDFWFCCTNSAAAKYSPGDMSSAWFAGGGVPYAAGVLWESEGFYISAGLARVFSARTTGLAAPGHASITECTGLEHDGNILLCKAKKAVSAYL